MKIESRLLENVFAVRCKHSSDLRGSFLKMYSNHAFLEQGIGFTPAEVFISTSQKGVIRGMHYQEGSAAHDKLVYCVQGKVLDVIVDIRPSSPSFNVPVSIELDGKDDLAIYIGKGYAHGFLSLINKSSMIYCTSTVHDVALDKGVLWSSINFEWPIFNPILSQRDRMHPPINNLK